MTRIVGVIIHHPLPCTGSDLPAIIREDGRQLLFRVKWPERMMVMMVFSESTGIIA